MGLNGVPVARHGLILRQDGGAGSRMFFRPLSDGIFSPFGVQIGPQGSQIKISIYLRKFVRLVVLTPKARRREGLNGTCCPHFCGIRRRVPTSYLFLLFTVLGSFDPFPKALKSLPGQGLAQGSPMGGPIKTKTQFWVTNQRLRKDY